MDFADDFEELISTEMAADAVTVFAGFMAPTVTKNLLQGSMPDAVDHREVYGLLTGAAGYMVIPSDGDYGYDFEFALGSMTYVADALAERTGVKSSVVEVGA